MTGLNFEITDGAALSLPISSNYVPPQSASASAESNKTEALGSAIWIHRDFAGLKLEELGYE